MVNPDDINASEQRLTSRLSVILRRYVMSRSYHPLVHRNYPEVISLVIPIYNEAEVLPLLIARINGLLAQLRTETEVILVNDGSSDRSMDRLLEQAGKDSR